MISLTRQSETTQAKTQETTVNFTFTPFYDRLWAPFPVLSRVFISFILGLGILVFHYFSVGSQAFTDWSWFLSILVCTAMLSLYYATYTLGTLFPEMDVRLSNHAQDVYRKPLSQLLSDERFLFAGVFFALINGGFGMAFGLPYPQGPGRVTIMGGYLVAGFVCGMAALGIYGMTVSIQAFAREAKSSFDFTAPDRCGGMLFLGEALLIFSSVTLIVGVMISIYILRAPWSNGNPAWIMTFKVFWICFPYIMSFVALIAPAVPLNKALRRYKLEQEVLLQESLKNIRESLKDSKHTLDHKKELREDYEFKTTIRDQLHRMRTWPYGIGANLKYLAVVMANLLASANRTFEWAKEHLNV